MKEGLISVIIPVYNAEKFIKRTISSVLSQTYENFEILILDDGSTDETKSVIENMKRQDNRIKYFYQPNHGLAYTRTRLCEMASGEYIALLDHDDEWLPDKLSKQIILFKKNPDCALVYGDVIHVYNDGSRANYNHFKNRKPHRGKVFYEYLLDGNFIPQPSIVFKSEVLRPLLPFRSELKISVDWELFLRLSRDYNFDYVEESVAIYNLHNDRTTAKNPLLEVDEILAIMDFWYRNDLNLRTIFRKRFLRSKAKINLQKTYFYQANQSYKKELIELVKCLQIDPIWFKPYLKLIKTSLFIMMIFVTRLFMKIRAKNITAR